MKLSHKLFATAVLGFVAIGAVAYLDFQGRSLKIEQVAGKSPKQVYPKYEGLGSGHGFGLNIVYTINHKETVNGFISAVVVSDEPGVEIHTFLPAVAGLPVGTRFKLDDNASNFEDAIRIVASN